MTATVDTMSLARAERSDLAELLTMVNDHLDPSGLTAKFGGQIALTDGLIHHQDILRSLGLQRTIPPERLVAVLDFARASRPWRNG